MWERSACEVGLFGTIQSRLAPVLEGVSPVLGAHVLLASDYGGTHRESKYHTFSFLAADLQFAWIFLDECKAIRAANLGIRRMSYKSLNDGHRRRALVPFLRAGNTIPGFIVTFAIEKTLGSLFEEDWESLQGALPGLDSFKVATSRKLFHIGHLAGLTVCPWLTPGTDLTWLTDDDDFTASIPLIRSSTDSLATIISEHSKCDLGHFRFGSASYVDVNRQSEDLLALSDLCCGAVSDTAQLWHVLDEGETIRSMAPLADLCAKPKAQLVMGWLTDPNSFSLKKVVLRLRSSSDGGVLCERMLSDCDAVMHFDPSELLRRHLT